MSNKTIETSEDLGKKEFEARIVRGIYKNIIRPMEFEIVRLRSSIDSLETRLPSKITKLDNVQDFIKANKYAIIDFYSDNCLPCYKLNPALEKFAGEDNGIAIGKLDIEKYSEEADKFDVSSIPLLISFADGKIIQQSIGAPSEPDDAIDMVKSIVQRVQIPNEDFDKMKSTVEKIAKVKGWHLNPDIRERDYLITALVWNKINKGKQYCPCKVEEIPENVCPCRAVEGKYKSSEDMVKESGSCYCGLFVSEEMIKEMNKKKAET